MEYKNIHTGRVLTEAEYDAMIEREAKEYWENEEAKEIWGGFEAYKEWLKNQPDSDFEVVDREDI